MDVVCGLLIAAFETTLSLSDAEATQPVYVLGGVVAPAALGTAGEGQRPEPLAEPQPTRTYAQFRGGSTYRECALLLGHAHTLRL
jgi:hypothetical protein